MTLQESQSDAATPLLVHALEAPISAIHNRALETLLARRNSASHDLILQRLHTLNDSELELIRKKGYLSPKSLRDSLLGSDRQICANGCQAILWFHEYGMASTLLQLLYKQPCRYEELISETFLQLMQALCDDWNASFQEGKNKDQAETQRQFLSNKREQVLETLRLGINEYGIKHRRTEPIQGLLRLADPDEPILSKILENPRHPAFAPIMNTLAKSKAPNITQRLLLANYRNPNPAKALLAVAANRSDDAFLNELFGMLRSEMRDNETIQKNLRHIENVPWIDNLRQVVGPRSEEEQAVILQYLLNTKLSRNRLLEIVSYFLTQGKTEARRIASEVMTQFSGRQANRLLIKKLDDSDPIVQANIIKTIRHRGIPEAAGQVFKLKDSPHQVVQEAIRETFNEFSFQRYLRSYGMLDEDTRQQFGHLAYEIDPEATTLLKKEFQSDLRKARERALSIVETLSLAGPFEEELSEIVNQKDYLLQIQALELLATLSTETSKQQIRDAVHDPNEFVSDTARRLLSMKENQVATKLETDKETIS